MSDRCGHHMPQEGCHHCFHRVLRERDDSRSVARRLRHHLKLFGGWALKETGEWYVPGLGAIEKENTWLLLEKS